jgi:hypothetical protein
MGPHHSQMQIRGPISRALAGRLEPQRPDPNKSINDNGEALADLAVKFRECSARQAKLVGWFDP